MGMKGEGVEDDGVEVECGYRCKGCRYEIKRVRDVCGVRGWRWRGRGSECMRSVWE